jgi:hypothetical protein
MFPFPDTCSNVFFLLGVLYVSIFPICGFHKASLIIFIPPLSLIVSD